MLAYTSVLIKALSDSLGRVDFFARKVTFKAHLPNGQGSSRVFNKILGEKLWNRWRGESSDLQGAGFWKKI